MTVTVKEENGQLCLSKDYTNNGEFTRRAKMTVQFGEELEYLIDVLRAYQYDHEQQQDAY